MVEVSFYRSKKTPLQHVLRNLLLKARKHNKRVVLQFASRNTYNWVDQYLWEYSPTSFLAHAGEEGSYAAEQDIYLTLHDDNPNRAHFRFLLPHVQCDDLSPYERVFVLFDERDENLLLLMQQQRARYQRAGYKVSYWGETAGGEWIQEP